VRPRPDTASASSDLPVLARELPRIAAAADRAGALGLLLVDGAALAPVEATYGPEAAAGVQAALGRQVREALGGSLGPADVLAWTGLGSPELVAVFTRPPGARDFLRRDLFRLCERLEGRLRDRAARIGYPYLRRAPLFALGEAVGLYNRSRGIEGQLRRLLDEARDDARLRLGLLRKRRRRELLDVLLGGAIRSVYEPIVEVGSRTVFGYEALARGPEGELESPAVLFELAAECDLVFELDCLCRRSGLEGARGLPAGTRLFLNFMPTAMRDPDFRGDALRRTLERIGLAPADVVFEISERESIENFAIFRELRDHYRSLGFQIALDDTGTGYSSLRAVIELAPDFIKVDRVFVEGADRDPPRRELLRALHAVAGKIGARIIGEGLNTLEELSVLGELGIPFGQGWLFGRPTPLRADPSVRA